MVLASAPAPATLPLLAFGMPGPTEWIIIAIIGLLIFGRRLPEVGRSLGRSIVEFKRGIKGIDDEIDTEAGRSASQSAGRSEPPRIPSSPPGSSTPPGDPRSAEGARAEAAYGSGEPNPYASTSDPERRR